MQRILVDMPCGMVTNNSYAALTKHVLKINRNIYIYKNVTWDKTKLTQTKWWPKKYEMLKVNVHQSKDLQATLFIIHWHNCNPISTFLNCSHTHRTVCFVMIFFFILQSCLLINIQRSFNFPTTTVIIIVSTNDKVFKTISMSWKTNK